MEERLQEHENELASFNSNEKVEEKKEEIETLDEPIIEATVSTDEPVEEEIETLDESKTDEPVEEKIEVLDEPKEEKTDEEKKEPETIDLGLESFSPPVYETGSLGALRKSGKLPQNLSGRKLIEICKSLGMNTTDLHYKPSITELQRLTNDKDIKLAFTNLNILSKHEKQLERFDKVLQSYDKLDTEGLDNNFAHRVEVESNKVRSDILEYEAKAKEMLAGSVLEHTSSQHIKNRLEALDAKSDKFNDKLKEQYQKLDAEMKAEKNTKIKQMFSDYRIRKMEKKIDSLSKKQNKVSGKQFEIMNEQTDKYIEKRTKDLLKYQEKQKKTENKIAQVNELMKQREALAEEIKKHEADLENTTGTKLVDRIERSQLNRAKGKLEREVERLDKKINRSNKQAQVSLTWSEAIARTDDGATLTR